MLRLSLLLSFSIRHQAEDLCGTRTSLARGLYPSERCFTSCFPSIEHFGPSWSNVAYAGNLFAFFGSGAVWPCCLFVAYSLLPIRHGTLFQFSTFISWAISMSSQSLEWRTYFHEDGATPVFVYGKYYFWFAYCHTTSLSASLRIYISKKKKKKVASFCVRWRIGQEKYAVNGKKTYSVNRSTSQKGKKPSLSEQPFA